MRTLVIGCGSIGSRRARLLAEMGHEVAVWDVDSGRANQLGVALHAEHDDRITVQLTALPALYAVFICTPAATHMDLAHTCVDMGCGALFIEKPLSTSMDGVAELVAECEARGVVTMGACNVRWGYRDMPRRDRHDEAVLCLSKPLHEWRAGAESYRATGVIIAGAIHEMDLAQWLCGPIEGCDAIGNADTAIIHLTHVGGAESRIYASWTDVEERGRWIALDGEATRYHANPSDEQYRLEMAHFLDCVANGTATTNPIANAAETLRWALHARDLTRKVTT